MSGQSRCAIRRAAAVFGATGLLMLAAASSALAQSVDIQSAGPLTDITIGDDLTCQVVAGGSQQFFGGAPGSCGTMVFAGDQLYGFNGDDWTTVTGPTLAGSGTAQDPYTVTTTVQDPNGVGITVKEVDSYVVGQDSYRTDITVQNTSDSPMDSLVVYHTGDCWLDGDDAGFGFQDPTSGSIACTQNANNSPAGPLMEFSPVTAGDHWWETDFGDVTSGVPSEGQDYPDSCDCTIDEDNGMGVNWDIASLASGHQATFSVLTTIVAGSGAGTISATAGQPLSGAAPAAVSGTVATFSDTNPAEPSGDFTASIDWGDGTSSAGAISGGGGSFSVFGNHTYTTPGTYSITVTITQLGNPVATVTDSASIAPPAVITSAPVVTASGAAVATTSTEASFSGSANPEGLPTTVGFQYGLDPKYTGGGPVLYTQSTPGQAIGADFASHTVNASVSGLVPNALYHVRLVATNSAGTTFGADQTFTTPPGPAPSTPSIGKTVNVSVVSGVVLIQINGQLVPLTELRQIPTNTVIDSLGGTLKLTTAIPGSHGARDAAAKGKKPKGKTATQSGAFGGAIFKITQAHSGLTTLTLVDNAFKGAPSYAECTKKKAGDASAAALSSKTLQLLHASAHGKFATKGKYAAATVQGTKWTIADRCDGTLTHDITDSVAVTDFVRHKTIVLHAGQSYLAKAPKQR